MNKKAIYQKILTALVPEGETIDDGGVFWRKQKIGLHRVEVSLMSRPTGGAFCVCYVGRPRTESPVIRMDLSDHSLRNPDQVVKRIRRKMGTLLRKEASLLLSLAEFLDVNT